MWQFICCESIENYIYYEYFPFLLLTFKEWQDNTVEKVIILLDAHLYLVCVEPYLIPTVFRDRSRCSVP